MSSNSKKDKLPKLAGTHKQLAATVTTELSQELFVSLTRMIESEFVPLKYKQKLAAILDTLPEDGF